MHKYYQFEHNGPICQLEIIKKTKNIIRSQTFMQLDSISSDLDLYLCGGGIVHLNPPLLHV